MSSIPRHARFLVLSTLLLAAAASRPAQATEEARSARRPSTPEICRSDDRLAGDWSSYRPAADGPSWLRFRFDCDCTYVSRAETAAVDARERGQFRIERDALVLTSPSGTRRWPLRFQRNDLWLTEGPEQTDRRYRRTARGTCSSPDR